MRFGRRAGIAALAALVLSISIISTAQAAAQLQIFDNNGNTVWITDQCSVIGATCTVADANSFVGAVVFNGIVGNWNINVVTGLSKPILGSAGSPHMDLNFTNNFTGGAGSVLTIWWSDTGFTASPVGLVAEVGATLNAPAGSSVLYQTYADAGNTEFVLTTLLTSLSFTTSPFAGSASSLYSEDLPPYSLTQAVVLNFAGAGNVSGNTSLFVPEPGTLLLLGGALAALAASRRRRGRKA